MRKETAGITQANKTTMGTFGLMVLAVLANAQTVDCKKPQNEYKKECQNDKNTSSSHTVNHGASYYPMYANGMAHNNSNTQEEHVKKASTQPMQKVTKLEPIKTVAPVQHVQPVMAAPASTKSSFFASSRATSVSSSSFGG